MSETNAKIKDALKECKMYQWQLAKLLGVSEPTLTRWLREELPEAQQEAIIAIIRDRRSQND